VREFGSLCRRVGSHHRRCLVSTSLGQLLDVQGPCASLPKHAQWTLAIVARAPSRFVTSRHRWLAKSAKNAGRVSLAIGPRVDGEGPIAPLLPATQSNATVATVLSFGVRQVGEKLGNDSGIGWVRGHELSPMFVQVGK